MLGNLNLKEANIKSSPADISLPKYHLQEKGNRQVKQDMPNSLLYYVEAKKRG